MKKFDETNPPKGGFKKGVAQRKPDPSPPLTDLPSEFLDLITSARANKSMQYLGVERTAEKSACGVSTIWRDTKRGVFVPPVRISSKNVAWVEVEVDAVLAAKALMSRTGKKIDLAQFVAALIEQPA